MGEIEYIFSKTKQTFLSLSLSLSHPPLKLGSGGITYPRKNVWIPHCCRSFSKLSENKNKLSTPLSSLQQNWGPGVYYPRIFFRILHCWRRVLENFRRTKTYFSPKPGVLPRCNPRKKLLVLHCFRIVSVHFRRTKANFPLCSLPLHQNGGPGFCLRIIVWICIAVGEF